MTSSRSVARAAAGMGAAAAVSRGFGFVRVLVVAAVLGTTYLGNTFQASNSVSNVLFELLAAGALSAVLVPTFVELLDRGDQRRTEHLANSVLGLALVVLGAITLVGVIGAPWLAQVLSSGASDAHIAAEQASLATFLLRFFVPQLLLYALGAVAIAVLYAQRRFVVTAAAPIASTVVIVIAMVVFRLLVGPGEPGLDLTTAEKLTLALGGTLGVAGFVAVPTIALWRRGFRLRPRLTRNDPEVHRLLRLSSWAIFQHAGFGLLLGASLIVGNGVAGGVVAYQVAFVFFLAPYAVLAQPIHTTILPEISIDAARNDHDAFRAFAVLGARQHGGARRAGIGRDDRAVSADHAGCRVRARRPVGRRGPPRRGPGFALDWIVRLRRVPPVRAGVLRAGQQPHTRCRGDGDRVRRCRGDGSGRRTDRGLGQGRGARNRQ